MFFGDGTVTAGISCTVRTGLLLHEYLGFDFGLGFLLLLLTLFRERLLPLFTTKFADFLFFCLLPFPCPKGLLILFFTMLARK